MELKALLLSIKAIPWRLTGLIRLKEYDTGTSGGRSKERYRRAALTSLTQAFSKGVAILLSATIFRCLSIIKY